MVSCGTPTLRPQLLMQGQVVPINDADGCDTDVDILSTSAIHQGVPHVDFSLKINH